MLAAALLMQAAVVGIGVADADPASFDLAALPRQSTEPTVAEVLVATAVADQQCGPRDADPFGQGSVVICGERPRASYRGAKTARVDLAPRAVERLNPHVRCGTSSNPTGCFDAVPVVRMMSDGTVAVLPDGPRAARMPGRPAAGD